MSDRKFTIKPSREGLKVPYPMSGTRFLSADGDSVLKSSYWIRRIMQGDAVEVKEEKKKVKKEEVKKSKKSEASLKSISKNKEA